MSVQAPVIFESGRIGYRRIGFDTLDELGFKTRLFEVSIDGVKITVFDRATANADDGFLSPEALQGVEHAFAMMRKPKIDVLLYELTSSHLKTAIHTSRPDDGDELLHAIVSDATFLLRPTQSQRRRRAFSLPGFQTAPSATPSGWRRFRRSAPTPGLIRASGAAR